jgi:hypothetical protein
VGKRRLKNTALDYLMALKDDVWRARALEQASRLRPHTLVA